MPITYEEQYAARTAEMNASAAYKKIDVTYIVREAATEKDAMAGLMTALKTGQRTLEGLPLAGCSVAERIDDTSWRITVTYESPDNSGAAATDDDDDLEFGFDTSGGTRHVTVANTQRRIAGTMNAGNLVNWNGLQGRDSAVAGVDVPSANPRLWYAKVMQASSITTTKMRNWIEFTGMSNYATWRGWKPGELLFLGPSFSGKTTGSIKVTFNFAVRPNEKLTWTAGGNTTTFDVKGFEYVWTHTKTKMVNNVPTPQIDAVFVAGVVKYIDYSKLGI